MPYSNHEKNIFNSPLIIGPYRNSLYSLPTLDAKLKYTCYYAAYLKMTYPAINRNRSINAIAIHLIYMDNLLHGTQLRFAKKDTSDVGQIPRNSNHPQGLNPLTYKYRHFLM